jgi:hypothetical protein
MYLNPFDGARAKIVRSHKHFVELIAAQKAYSAEQPLTVSLVPQDNGDTAVMAEIAKLPPLEHRAIVADVINNFRAALDIATVQACIIRGQTDKKLLDKTYFAFAGSEKDWWDNVNAKHSRMAGADNVVRQTVASFKPWAANGNVLLYAMSKLVAGDKHTDLVPVSANTTQLDIPSIKVERGDSKATGISPKMPQWGDHGPVELLTVLAPAKVEITGPPILKASFGFGDVAGIKGKAVIPTLN